MRTLLFSALLILAGGAAAAEDGTAAQSELDAVLIPLDQDQAMFASPAERQLFWEHMVRLDTPEERLEFAQQWTEFKERQLAEADRPNDREAGGFQPGSPKGSDLGPVRGAETDTAPGAGYD